MKRKRKIMLDDGGIGYEPIDLEKACCLNYLRLTNKTHAVGRWGLPELICTTEVYPDFIALFGQPGLYHHTSLTAVGFWQYDEVFDGIDGLFNAIYYNDQELLDWYQRRFEGVRIFFTPDYTQFGDVDELEMLYRLKRARIVGLWLAIELHAVVIPFITVPTSADTGVALQGLENCTVVAFSTKGYATHPEELEEIKEMVRQTVETLHPEAIVVYDVCGDNSVVEATFEYAIEQGIKVIVPRNTLKDRNTLRKEVSYEK